MTRREYVGAILCYMPDATGHCYRVYARRHIIIVIIIVKGRQLHDSLNWEESHVLQRKHREEKKRGRTFQTNSQSHGKLQTQGKQMPSEESVTKRKQLREEEMREEGDSHIWRQNSETTTATPPRSPTPPQAAPKISPPLSEEAYKLPTGASQKLVQDKHDLDLVQRRFRRPIEQSKDRPLAIRRRLRRLSEGQGIVKDSKCKYRRSSLTDSITAV